jgi:hypothetical protein
MVEEYSRRLGKITPRQFQPALDRFGLGVFIRAEPIPFGLFGQNVFISSTQGEFVLRGVPHYPWQFPTGFIERQQLYTLGVYASMWEYWQRTQGAPPEAPAVGFEGWARPVVDFWTRGYGC